VATPADPNAGLIATMETLAEAQCWGLLATVEVGRLGLVVDDRPVVLPVNFALDGDDIVLRTDEGTKLYAARRGLVAFECDDVDGVYHTGWSVIITGYAEEVRDATELDRLGRLRLGPWCDVPKPVILRIAPRTISGRRIPPHGMHSSRE